MTSPSEELSKLREKGLLRALTPNRPHLSPQITINGHDLLNFSSNDYLGLSRHPTLIEASEKALRDFGTGSTASRLICGSLTPFHDLEESLAESKQTEAALSFPNGYMTAIGVIPALMGKNDTIILDKLAHACLIDAARLSGATLRTFPHNDLNRLEKILKNSSKGRTLIITESVFSMDGDLCPLTEIVQLKEQYGALLLLDEAHAFGVLGPRGQGLTEALKLQNHIDFQMGTLGKALGSAGGYLAASRPWIDLIINKARSFIYSTAPPPAQAAASLAALKILRSDEGQKLRETLRQHCLHFDSPSPIIPKIIGRNEDTLARSQALRQAGFFVPAIRYPSVPLGTARLRITLSAAHSEEQIKRLLAAL